MPPSAYASQSAPEPQKRSAESETTEVPGASATSSARTDETQAATAEETEQTAEQSERPWLADRDELKWYLAQHNALKDALERERQITDDQEAAELLRGAGRNVLSAVEIVLQDEVLWKRLASSTRAPLTADEIARVEGFTDAGLAGLLTGLGYREPPPLEELIGDTLTSFVEATQDPEGNASVAERRAGVARRELVIFTIRMRRLTGSSEGRMPPSLARRVLRKADREADDVLNAANGVLLPLAAEALFPGASLVAKLGAAAAGLVSQRLLALRPRIDDVAASNAEELDPPAALSRASRAVARLTAQADVVNGLEPAGDGPAQDLTIAQAWVADQAIRELIAADPDDRLGWHQDLYDALESLKQTRVELLTGEPVTAVPLIESLLDNCARRGLAPPAKAGSGDG